MNRFEKTEHFYSLCQSSLDRFIFLFCLFKMSIVEGKTVIFAKDIVQAYRIKIFLNRFHMKAFVLAHDMAKN